MRARRKRSEGKATWPGRKQVYRRRDADHRIQSDIVTLEGDPQEGEALLVPVMRGGRPLQEDTALPELRARVAQQLAELPPTLLSLEGGAPYPVEISESVRKLAKEI